MISTAQHRKIRAVVAVLGLFLTIGSVALAQVTPMTLRVNDSIGAPGGVVAFVAATRAVGSSSQPVRRGQADFVMSQQLQQGSPFSGYLGSEVFSEARDARQRLSPGQGSGFVLNFLSESVTINLNDGPLAVIYFRLRDDLVPGQLFGVSIDLADSYLINEFGDIIPIETRSGELKIRYPLDPYEIKVVAEDTVPGEIAYFSLLSAEPFLVSSGQAAFRFDPSIAGGIPLVQMDPRYGERNFTVDSLEPGLVLVTFDSPDASLNAVPGYLIEIGLPTAADVPPGTQAVITLDQELTFFADKGGAEYPVELIDGEFQFDF